MTRRPWTAFALLACLALAACTPLEEVPLEIVDLGSYRVVDFELPSHERAAIPYAQRMMGKVVVLGPVQVGFPAEFGQADCQHSGYRLSERMTALIQPFDLGLAGPLSAGEAGIEEEVLVEIWSSCLNGAYLTRNHMKLYLPGRGALFVLEKI